MNIYKNLNEIVLQVRRDILRMVHANNSGHPGGSLGCTEFFVALFFKIMNHNPEFNLNSYPNVEVKPGQLFLQNNKFLPECCFYYSDYSTDKGCPCITPEQQYYLQRRGLNRDKNCFLKETNDYANLFFSPTLAFKN